MKKILFVLLIVLLFNVTSYGAQNDKNLLYVSLPEINWAVAINKLDFVIEKSEFNEDGTSRNIFATDENTGIVMSIYLEPAYKKGDSKACREYYRNKVKNNSMKKEDIMLREIGEISLVEFTVKEYKNMKIIQKNINAYLVKDNIWIDIHLSKVNFTSEDEKLFADMLKSIKIVKEYTPTGMDYFEYGSNMFLSQNYKKSIIYYDKLLELEKKKRTLNKTGWRILVDNLSMAYGITGDLNKAKNILEYGISEDNSYPMFYYNLACAYAEMDDIENTLINLEKAYKYKKNMIKGEEFPNPKKDSSFSKFLKNKKFITLLENTSK